MFVAVGAMDAHYGEAMISCIGLTPPAREEVFLEGEETSLSSIAAAPRIPDGSARNIIMIPEWGAEWGAENIAIVEPMSTTSSDSGPPPLTWSSRSSVRTSTCPSTSSSTAGPGR